MYTMYANAGRYQVLDDWTPVHPSNNEGDGDGKDGSDGIELEPYDWLVKPAMFLMNVPTENHLNHLGHSKASKTSKYYWTIQAPFRFIFLTSIS